MMWRNSILHYCANQMSFNSRISCNILTNLGVIFFLLFPRKPKPSDNIRSEVSETLFCIVTSLERFVMEFASIFSRHWLTPGRKP